MVAFVHVETEVLVPEEHNRYRAGVPATVAAFGGSYVTRGAVGEFMEGEPNTRRITIIQFDSLAQAKAWYDSPEYRPLRELRMRAARSTLRMIEQAR